MADNNAVPTAIVVTQAPATSPAPPSPRLEQKTAANPDVAKAVSETAQSVVNAGRDIATHATHTVTEAGRAVASDASQHATDVQHAMTEAQRVMAADAQRRAEEAQLAAEQIQRQISQHTADAHHAIIETEQRVRIEAERRVAEAERELAEARRQLEEDARRRVDETRAQFDGMKNEVVAETHRRVDLARDRLDAHAQGALGESYQSVANDTRAIEDEVRRRLNISLLRRDSRNGTAGAGPSSGDARSPPPNGKSAVEALFSLGGTALAGMTSKMTGHGHRSASNPTAPASREPLPPPANPAYRQASLRDSLLMPPPPAVVSASGVRLTRSPDAIQGLDLPQLGYSQAAPGNNDHDPDEKGSSTAPGTRPSTWFKRRQTIMTVKDRLTPTIELAEDERDRCKMKARKVGFLVNMAIGLQVFFGALTTGLSAVLSGKKAGVTTSVFGGITTMLASYLARTRGSNEPELSRQRSKDLDNFVRDMKAVVLDRGDQLSVPFTDKDGMPDPNSRDEIDILVAGFRARFENIMGNANGERTLSTPV